MQFVPYFNFDGDCRQAFEYYKNVFGGELQIMTHADLPADEPLGDEWKDKVLNAELKIGDLSLFGSDVPEGMYQPTASTYISINVDSIEEAERIYAALIEGGTVEMPISEQFWAHRFGSGVDRFGVKWMVNCLKELDYS